MDLHFITTTATLLFMLMDPFGNLPVFVALLDSLPPERFTRVIFRESCFALVGVLLALVAGNVFLRLTGLSPAVLRIAGGCLLLVIGARMFFSALRAVDREAPVKEPFIVPIAIPLICGPGTLVMTMTLQKSDPAATFPGCLAAIAVAWIAQTLILLNGRLLARVAGEKALGALKSLIGLMLACMAVGMLLHGVDELYGLRPAG